MENKEDKNSKKLKHLNNNLTPSVYSFGNLIEAASSSFKEDDDELKTPKVKKD